MPLLTHVQFVTQALSVIGCDPEDLLQSDDSGHYSPEERLLELEGADTFYQGRLLDYFQDEGLGHKWKLELTDRSEFGEPRAALGFLSDDGAAVVPHFADADAESPEERINLEFYPASDAADAAAWLDKKASEFFSEEVGCLTSIVDDLAASFGRDRVLQAVNQALSGHS